MPKGECSICALVELRELVDRLLDEGKVLDYIAAQANLLLANFAPSRSVHRSSVFRHKRSCYLPALRLRAIDKKIHGARRLIVQWEETLSGEPCPKPICLSDSDSPPRELSPDEITASDTLLLVSFEAVKVNPPATPTPA